MTGAYDTFSNGGALVEPHAIRRVRMSSGRVLFARQAPRTAQVGDPMHVGYMNDMLASVVTSGTGRRAALAGHASAGKTGTSQDNRDAWFIGYTSHLTAGVWIGNDNGKPMKNAVGGGLPAEIWHEVMAAAHVNLAPLALPGVAAPVFDFDRRLPQDVRQDVVFRSAAIAVSCAPRPATSGEGTGSKREIRGRGPSRTEASMRISSRRRSRHRY